MSISDRTRLVAALLVPLAAGCGLLLGIEDHELGGGSTNPDGSVATDGNPNGGDGGGGADGGRDGALSDIETLATGQNQPRAIGVDATRVFWVNEGDGTVMSSLKTGGGALSTLADAAVTPRAVVVDLANVFWNSDTQGGCDTKRGIIRASTSGGPPTVLVTCTDTAGRIGGMAQDGNYVYWSGTTVGGVFGVPKVGGAAIPVSANVGSTPGALAANATGVYWAKPSANEIGMYSKLDGGVGVLASSVQGLAALTADDEYVYFSTLAAVQRVPPSGGTPTQLGPALNSPSAIALTSTHVYVATTGDGSIRRIAKADGAADVVASGQGGPRALVVDDSGVYWVNDSGEVRRRAFR